MSYSSLNRKETSTIDLPTFSRVRSDHYEGQALISSYKEKARSSKPITTWIRLNPELAGEANLSDGERVSVLLGVGKDEGKLRIVSNPDGGHTLTTRKYSKYSNDALYLRTTRLLSQKSKAKTAKVTSIAEGALTLSYLSC